MERTATGFDEQLMLVICMIESNGIRDRFPRTTDSRATSLAKIPIESMRFRLASHGLAPDFSRPRRLLPAGEGSCYSERMK